MEEKEKGTLEISFKDVLDVVKKHWWIIAISTILCAVIGFCYANVRFDQKYEAFSLNHIRNKEGASSGQTSSDIAASKSLVDTYCVFLTSPETLNAVIARTGVPYTVKQLAKMITADSVSNTEIMKITVVSTSGDEAIRIATALSEMVVERGPLVMGGTSASVVSLPDEYTALSRGRGKTAVIAALIGFILSFAVFFCYDLLINDVLESTDWIRSTYGDEIPLLATIPDTAEGERRKRRLFKRHRDSGRAAYVSEKEAMRHE